MAADPSAQVIQGTLTGTPVPVTPTGAAGTQAVKGDVAEGATDTAIPVGIGGRANNNQPAAVTAGKRVTGWFSLLGRLGVFPMSNTLAGDSYGAALLSGSDDIGNAAYVAQGVYDGTGSLGWNRLRTPTKVKTAAATAAGDTAVWTPTSGKRFRLMRCLILVTGDASTAGGADVDITLRDATTDLLVTVTVFVPAVAGTTLSPGFSSGWIDLGNGLISTTVNNVLNVNLSAALAAGKCRVIVAGTEE